MRFPFHPLFLALLPLGAAQAQTPRTERLPDGVRLHLPQANENAARTLRLRVVADKIVQVQASPLDTLSTAKSLMVVPQTGPAPTWQYREKKGLGELRTPALTATVVLATGEVSFADAQGRPVLRERPGGGKRFTPMVANGQPLYEVKQVFDAPPTEALYGLGGP